MDEEKLREEKMSASGNFPGNGEGMREKPPPGFLELIYGVLFEPGTVFRKVVARPPLGQTVIIFTLVNVIVALMNALVTSRLMYQHATDQMAGFMHALSPVLGILGLVFQYGKWFFYSGLLHLLAELLGGRGRATGVFIITGLASLPSIFIVPVNLLLFLFGVRGFTLSVLIYLLGIIILVWGAFLLVLGIREEHRFSTGRAVAVVLLPPAVALAGGIILMIALTATITSVLPFLPAPKLAP